MLVIARGDILEDALEKSGKSESWLKQKLQEHHVDNIDDVYMCEYFDNDINVVTK
nr:YetF domain-containing protein [Apilactobacillus ozensis]